MTISLGGGVLTSIPKEVLTWLPEVVSFNGNKIITTSAGGALVCENKNKIEKCLKACKTFNPVILDKTNQSVVIQITALRREVDKMNKKLKAQGLVST